MTETNAELLARIDERTKNIRETQKEMKDDQKGFLKTQGIIEKTLRAHATQLKFQWWILALIVAAILAMSFDTISGRL